MISPSGILFYDHSHGTQGGFHSIQNTQWTSVITSFCLSFSKSISRNQEHNLRQDQLLSSLAKDGSDPCNYVAITRLQHGFRTLLTSGAQKLKMFVYRNSKEQGLSRNVTSQLFKHQLYLKQDRKLRQSHLCSVLNGI